MQVGLIALVVIFQPELRKALEELGRKTIFSKIFTFGDQNVSPLYISVSSNLSAG